MPFRILPDAAALTNTLVVDPNGQADYTTIQGAINYAYSQTPTSASRWQILIMPGTYNESLTLRNYVDLSGLIPNSRSVVIRRSTVSYTTITSAAICTLANLVLGGVTSPIVTIASSNDNLELQNVIVEESAEVTIFSQSNGSLTLRNCRLQTGGYVYNGSGGYLYAWDTNLVRSITVGTPGVPVVYLNGARADIYRCHIETTYNGAAILINAAVSPYALRCYHCTAKRVTTTYAIDANLAVTGYIAGLLANAASDSGNITGVIDEFVNASI